MRRIFCAVLTLGLAGGIVALAIGLLAPWNPQFELANHGRPFTVAGTMALFGMALAVRQRWLILGIGGLGVVSVSLLVLPFTFAMPSASGPRTLRLTTFNLWIHNRNIEKALAYLRATEADVIVLQEIGPKHTAALLPRLGDLYPHSISCAQRGWRCDSALLSKRPWQTIEAVGGFNADKPPMLRARFRHDGRDYDVAGVHVAYPFQAEQQARHVDGLIDLLATRSRPVIIAGDFNLTPFSWGLTRFAARTGLRRAATLGGSWSTRHLAPAVLIDHVFASEEFSLEGVAIGPEAGSDHLPVTVDLVMR